MEELQTSYPREHTKNIREELQKIADHVRRDLANVDDLRQKHFLKLQQKYYWFGQRFQSFRNKERRSLEVATDLHGLVRIIYQLKICVHLWRKF